jgi:putative DNA primase/helicase
MNNNMETTSVRTLTGIVNALQLRVSDAPIKTKYVAGASNDAAVEPGGRNDRLTSLAGTMRRRGMEAEAIEAALQVHNAQRCNPPLSDDEVRAIARSVANYAPNVSDDVFRSLTDAGNSQRFAQRYSGTLRYVSEWGQWIVWQGSHWEADTTGAVMELAKALARAIYDEGTLADPELRIEIAKHAKRTASGPRLKAMLELAASQPELVLHASDLDSHRGLLGVENGTLDLASGKLRPAAPDDYITMLAPVAYDPAAQCPEFMRFLSTIMGGSQALVDFLQRVLGYAMSGYTPEQCLFFCFGTGANGKSTLLNAFRDLLGHQYYMVMPSDALMVRPGKSGATPELARLPGARVVVTNEVEDGTHLAESLVKLMTGGDRIAARHLYQSFFEFVPQFKLFIVGNHKPVVRGDDYGIWRRIHLVPFLVTIPPEERDPDLQEKLRKELPGILNWAVAGYQAWRTRGLAPPPEVTEAVEIYKQEMDIFGQWIDECCKLGDDLETVAWSAYDSFRTWAALNGFKGWTSATFGRKVRERFSVRRTSAAVHYCGFGLKGDAARPWSP